MICQYRDRTAAINVLAVVHDSLSLIACCGSPPGGPICAVPCYAKGITDEDQRERQSKVRVTTWHAAQLCRSPLRHHMGICAAYVCLRPPYGASCLQGKTGSEQRQLRSAQQTLRQMKAEASAEEILQDQTWNVRCVSVCSDALPLPAIYIFPPIFPTATDDRQSSCSPVSSFHSLPFRRLPCPPPPPLHIHKSGSHLALIITKHHHTHHAHHAYPSSLHHRASQSAVLYEAATMTSETLLSAGF